jgi:hypothetical protein
LVQALTRPGFDLTRQPLSLLSLGDGGWVQTVNFAVAGLLSIACAIGLRRALRAGRGGTWGPILIGAWGIGLLAGGAFAPDPALGFPPGSPAGNPEMLSWRGILHSVAFNVGTLALSGACVAFARRFASLKESVWLAGSVGSAIAVPALVKLGTALGVQGAPGAGIVFFLIPVVAWSWLSLLALHLSAARSRRRAAAHPQ